VRLLLPLLSALLLTSCYVDPFGTAAPESEADITGDPADDDDATPPPDDDDDDADDDDADDDDDDADDDDADDDDDDDDDDADDDDATPEPLADDAVIVSASLPATLACGESFDAIVSVRNTGTATWTGDEPNGYKLGAVDDSDPFTGPDPRIWMGDAAIVPPNAVWAFPIPMTAPAEAGTYTSDWQMVHEGVTWFGEATSAVVEVECTEPAWTQVACARNGSEICDDESFGVDPGTTYGVLCEGPNDGIGYVATNTGPAHSDGVNRCQGWEDQGLDAWDFLDYVGSLVCDTAGEVLELDLSPWAGGSLWFGSHDNPGGGGHMTNICLAELN